MSLRSLSDNRPTLARPRAACLLSCLVVLLLWPSLAQSQRGALVMQRNLGELVDQAETIIRGHVVSARVEPHRELTNLYTIVITLRVAETLKGEASETFTFRQYIWDIRDRYDAAGYKKGQHLLLLVNKPSQYGLSSPAGMDQGRFRILRDRQGRESAVNGFGNAGLFRDIEPLLARKGVKLAPPQAIVVAQHESGPIALDDLRGLIRTMAGTK